MSTKKDIHYQFTAQDKKIMKTLTEQQVEVLNLISTHKGETSLAYRMAGVKQGTFYSWMKYNDDFSMLVDKISAHYFGIVYNIKVDKAMSGDKDAMDWYLRVKGRKYGVSERDLPTKVFLEGEDLTQSDILIQTINQLMLGENQQETGALRSDPNGDIDVGNVNAKDLIKVMKELKSGR
jgi:hypothetical protein